MFDVECLNPAYERLEKSGIKDIILREERKIKDILMYRDIIMDENSERILNEAKKFIFDWNNSISDKWKCFEDIVSLDFLLDSEGFVIDLKSFFVEHPSFISYYLLGEEIFNYEKFGFPSRKSLEESIAGFCAGEINFNNRSCVWRNKDLKNEISSNEHGDFYACQKNVFGKELNKNTLFGNVSDFEIIGEDVDRKSINAYQNWSRFLWSLLKYSEIIGKQDIAEIVNWEDVIEETGFIGTATAEAMFGSGYNINRDSFKERCIISENSEIETFPFIVGNSYFPYFQEGKLVFLEENDKGDIKLNTRSRLDNLRFSKSVVFDDTDLPYALRATYKLYSRDRSELIQIMNYFNNN